MLDQEAECPKTEKLNRTHGRPLWVDYPLSIFEQLSDFERPQSFLIQALVDAIIKFYCPISPRNLTYVFLDELNKAL
jgi:hypothetical protein